MRIPLDGRWLFSTDPDKAGVREGWYTDSIDRSEWDSIEVPCFWETLSGLSTYDGWGWYAREFMVEKTTEPMSIHFAGIDDDAVVWLNGEEVGTHSGYSDPFALDVSEILRDGKNLIVVQVIDYDGGGGIYKPITLVETKYLDDLLKSEYFGMPAVRSADWVKDAVIYEAYLRSCSPEGTFAGLERRVPQLKALGITVLWLMPIHPIGMKNRKGVLGSPYALQDYYSVNPEFGTLRDFKKLLNTVHKNGMKLIIDLVANHTAWDSRLMMEHPEWFTRDSAGNIMAPNSDWTDVADLDYSRPGLHRYMIEVMRYWVKDVGVDGFRCDVAELVPTTFWEEARRRLNPIKPVMMLSEGTLPEHHVKAFDLTYSWNIYDILKPLLDGKHPATVIDEILKMERLQFPTGAIRMRFTTNHDKNAWDAPAVTKFGNEGLKLAAVLVNTIPGVPLLYTGEEVANDRKLSLFDRAEVDWNRPRDMEQLYRSLFTLRREHKALSRGEMVRVASSHDHDVYAFFRVAGSDRVFVVLNFSSEPRFSIISIPMERVFPGERKAVLKDIFDETRVEAVAGTQEQIVLALEPRAYKVFVIVKE
jgi:glycosidase